MLSALAVGRIAAEEASEGAGEVIAQRVVLCVGAEHEAFTEILDGNDRIHLDEVGEAAFHLSEVDEP